MKLRRNDVLLKTIMLLGGLLAVPAWASSAPCSAAAGTGMGGTGIVAEGTGMGGTGITPAALAGKVMFSHGNVIALNKGSSRPLAKGDPVCVGDTIKSAEAASAQLVMIDNEMIAVRPQTKIRIDSYSYRKKRDDNIALSLIDGAARIISGDIGKRFPQNDLIKARNVTIGIRGTDHEAAIILPGQNAAYPAGIYDKVNTGVTFIKTDKGIIDIHPNQVGFAADPEEMPKLLHLMPAFYNTPSFPLSSTGTGLDNRTRNGDMEMQQGLEKSFEWRGPEPGQSNTPDMQPLPESQSMPEHQLPSGDMTQPSPSTSPYEH
jgi:hypothetical protein